MESRTKSVRGSGSGYTASIFRLAAWRLAADRLFARKGHTAGFFLSLSPSLHRLRTRNMTVPDALPSLVPRRRGCGWASGDTKRARNNTNSPCVHVASGPAGIRCERVNSNGFFRFYILVLMSVLWSRCLQHPYRYMTQNKHLGPTCCS